jgi:hypothetical protein
MKKIEWFERQFTFGLPSGMIPFYLERLRGTIVRLERKVDGISNDILSHKIDGKWSIKQNIGHLAEVDEVVLRRLDEILHGVSPMSPAVFDTQQDYNTMSIDDVLNFFRENRVKNIHRYESLNESELQRSSLHPRLKQMMTPVDLAWFDAEHDDHHAVRINEIIQTLDK